jgi:hypothetical protein
MCVNVCRKVPLGLLFFIYGGVACFAWLLPRVLSDLSAATSEIQECGLLDLQKAAILTNSRSLGSAFITYIR